jgi:hypothetical protein
MALISCYECGQQISSEATSCPQCGAPQKSTGVAATTGVAPPPAGQPESVVWEGRKSHLLYGWYWFFGILLAVVLVGIFMIAWIYLDRSRRRYRITTRRVIMESGIAEKCSSEVRIQDIRNMNVVRRGFPGLFDVGNIEFGTAGEEGIEVTFIGIPHPARVKEMVSQLQG